MNRLRQSLLLGGLLLVIYGAYTFSVHPQPTSPQSAVSTASTVATTTHQPTPTTTTPASASSTIQTLPGTYHVTRVIDGDTFAAWDGTELLTIRVLGIDAPETAHSPTGAECYNQEAAAAATKLLASTTVTLAIDTSQDRYDAYHRLLAYITLPDHTDFGERMITNGYAREYTFKGRTYAQQAAYRRAEGHARAEQRGLWSCP